MKLILKFLFAVIGGSQAYNLLQRGSINGKRIGEIQTPFGNYSQYITLTTQAMKCFSFKAWRKGYSLTAPFVNYRANIYALKNLESNILFLGRVPGL